MLRFTDAADAVRVALLPTGDGCTFAWNDGSGDLRTPTRLTCGDLVVGPLWQSGYHEQVADVCAPR